MKNNLNKTHILFIFAIFSGLFLLGTCFFLCQKISDTSNKIDTRRQEVVTQEKEKNNEHQLTAFIKKEINPAKVQMTKYFVNEYNYIGFIKDIETLAKKSNIDVEIKSTELPEALRLNLNFEGSFNDSMYFIALVESLPINLKIDSVRMEQAKEDNLWRGWVVVMMLGSGGNNN